MGADRVVPHQVLLDAEKAVMAAIGGSTFVGHEFEIFRVATGAGYRSGLEAGRADALRDLTGESGVLMKLAMGETDAVVTCGCGNRFGGDAINDAVLAWTTHVTQGGCPLKERL